MTVSGHPTERSDTYGVSVHAPPEFVWAALSAVEQWPRFSPFARAVAPVEDNRYRVTSPQGPVTLISRFDRDRLLLDHTVVLGDGTEVFIPYRVVPNHRGSELIMTNVKSPGDSAEEYAEQLRWMREELDGAKRFVETGYRSRPAS